MAKTKAMKIAIVDDEQDMRQSISQWLALSGFDTETYSSAEDALKSLGPDYPGAVVSDIKMPNMDGLAFLKRLMSIDSALPVIMITGHGDVPMAVDAMRIGAYDFLEKPFNPDRMAELVKKATEYRRFTLDNRALRRELSDGATLMKNLVGESEAMQRLREDILDLGQAEGHVLIEGETGTGKTLAAQALHAVGARSGKKFIRLSCAGDNEKALARRLFGPAEKEGDIPALDEARGGTLVLEDIETLPKSLQPRLLSWLNDQSTPAETRIIAISNIRDHAKTCEDVLRPDLFYRLASMRIMLPPLRQRDNDILILFSRFGEQFAEEYGCDAPRVSARDAAQLMKVPWPGNIRQLANVAEQAVLQSRSGLGTFASLLISGSGDEAQPVVTAEGKPLKECVEAFERTLIDNTMRRHKGSITRVMEELCLPRRTLNEKMTKYGLHRSDYLSS